MDKAYLNIRNNGRPSRSTKGVSTFTIVKKKESMNKVDRFTPSNDLERYQKISTAFINLHQ